MFVSNTSFSLFRGTFFECANLLIYVWNLRKKRKKGWQLRFQKHYFFKSLELPEFGSFTIINVKTGNQILNSVIGTLDPDLMYQPESTLVSVFERRRSRKRLVEVRKNEGEEMPPGNEYKKYISLIDLFSTMNEWVRVFKCKTLCTVLKMIEAMSLSSSLSSSSSNSSFFFFLQSTPAFAFGKAEMFSRSLRLTLTTLSPLLLPSYTETSVFSGR